MPIYEYVCPTCGVFEEMRKVSDPSLTTCPRGHAGVQRQMSASGFILKGSGWYVTDYARKGSKNGAGAKDGQATGNTSPEKAEKAADAKASDTSSTKTTPTTTGSGT